MDQGKIDAVAAWPRPTNIYELRGFLGLTGYYRKFVQNYGILARPLTTLLKKGQFRWNEEAEVAFIALKKAMTSTPTLAMPNFQETFTIEADASGDGIGAVLSQQGKPITFMSHALGVTKKTRSTYAKEMLTIVEAIRTWRPYILGKKFIIQTDQQSLKYFVEQCVATPEQQKWVAKLMGYDYEIVYKPGRDNSAADSLSRKPGSPTLHHMFTPQVHLWDEIREASKGDPYITQVGCEAATKPEGPFKTCHGLVFYKTRIVVPKAPTLHNKILEEFHARKTADRLGVLRTYKRLTQQFYWPTMYRDVQEFVARCEAC